MTQSDANKLYGHLATEARRRDDAIVRASALMIQTADGDQFWIALCDRKVQGVDSSGRWTWHHASIADYLAEREATNNWTFAD